MRNSYPFKIGIVGMGFILMIAALYLVFIYVPTESTMGVVQRIFYFHVPLAWVSFLAFFIVFINSILYLWKRDIKWDVFASSSAVVGLIFTTLFLISGSIWAKSIWGVWWTWDPRLTAALVLWLMYMAYMLVRTYAVEQTRAARFCAVVGIVGFLDVPIVALAITLWRTQHPSPVIFQGGLAPSMLLTLMVCIVAFTVLYIILLMLRIAITNDENEINVLTEAR
ncbi:MAG: cytochrome c biogenesis protein CcsA [Candidatus Margulisiibacteriota bacterium]